MLHYCKAFTVGLETTVQSIKFRSQVGSDGILHLDVPVGLRDAELEVTLTIRPATPKEAKTLEDLGYPSGFFERTAGCFEDEPLVRYPQGELQERNWDDLPTRY